MLYYSDLGIYDRVIVQDVIKSIAQTQQFDVNARHQFKGKELTKTYRIQFLLVDAYSLFICSYYY
jgi:hypothetical protein